MICDGARHLAQIKADGQAPEVLQRAFGSVLQLAGGGSGDSGGRGARLGADAKRHAEAAVARRCLDMLAERAPLLHDLCALAGEGTDLAPTSSSSVEEEQRQQQRQLQDAVVWARATRRYQHHIQALAEQVAAVGRSASPGAQAAQQQQQQQQSPPEGALRLLSVAGCGTAASLQVVDVVDVMLADAGPAAAAATPPSSSLSAEALASSEALRVALLYRVQKKLVLWDFLLACPPDVLRQAVG